MGHSSKFVFPLPGRKQKPSPAAPPSGPLTKAQKILGTTELNIDSIARPAWETQSNSGISIAISETTDGNPGHNTTHDGWATSTPLRDRRWEQESEIIPAALNGHVDMAGSMPRDGTTDASSLRRQQSSSTITSYYDKSKLPLSISQQTSNSAMAKGLPAKAQALLDIDGELTEAPQGKKPRKKPSRLDFASLLHKHKSPKHLHPDASKVGQVLGHDMLTKSPSLTSASPAPTPPPGAQQADRSVRKKLTKESLRSQKMKESVGEKLTKESLRSQQTKDNVDLYNLYYHYEQRTFADAIDRQFEDDSQDQLPSDRHASSFPAPARRQSGQSFLSPFPPNPSRAPHGQPPFTLGAAGLGLGGAGTPSPVPADCASVSSRHTRTSKASKRTERSLQEIDLLQNSVLALSSDSEDDYELSSKGSLAVPALSDGQRSPTSPRSQMSQISGAGTVDSSRGKPVKRTSFVATPQTFPGMQGPAATKGPKITPRSSSLKQGPSLVHQTSRLSIGTASTDRTVLRVSQSGGSDSGNAAKTTLKKMRSESRFDFPAPPVHRNQRSVSSSRSSEHARPASPTSMDLYLQSQRSLPAPDSGSIRSGRSLGSTVNGGRRGSATSSIHDGNSGRFMAVTRQEEMLLAALRMKRARMREDIITEFEEMGREDHQLKRELTNESNVTAGSMSRQSSWSTVHQETAALSARPRQQVQTKAAPTATEMKQKSRLLQIVIDRTPLNFPLRTPASEISDFTHVDDGVGSPGAGGLQRQDSKASSVSSQRSAPTRQRASLTAMSAPGSRRPQRRDGGRGSEQLSANGQTDLPRRILEDPAEDEDHGIPRPDSPVSPLDFPVPMSIKNNKQVRLSAVGFYKPNIGAGW